MTYAKDKEEVDFAYKVRRAMTESSEMLPSATLERLASARKLALSRQKQEEPSRALAFGGILAGSNGTMFSNKSWLKKLWISLPLLVLMLGLYGIYEYEQEQQINDLAEIDAAVLVDELPPDAYLDNGFNAYLNKETPPAKSEE
ncbi:DUF3619 family protein [Undibacterium fentianense]|uniref:DUF3619 family protein n=1 Tax=Undibacterium fentianense TaxID=2828728 RepID=A0A941IF63_9BURK|nr:DUF3619 family protein [Undibacterium fentianense]MBR7798735.1 DUF3619 family protein [Undibacterium fentianense]